MDKNYLTSKEAADYIGTTRGYLYKLAFQQHKIPYYSPTGRKMLFKREELDAWIEKGRVSTNDELESKAATDAALYHKRK